ncbi:MAG TPA: hypothetical protein VG293_10205 [Solirubrobacteraceae bacterium]|nr:hypothetical protein [Solirubrobacteraceae bacterium]
MSEDDRVQNATPEALVQRALVLPPIAAIQPSVATFAGDVYLVGGSIRDLILGRRFVDVDLAVDGDAGRLAAAIGAPLGAETRFGTVSVELGGHRYDIARTRAEAYEHPGALPVVQEAGIDADLRRRDFTVNALALGLAGTRTGELLSAPRALEDLQAAQLAVLHDRSFLDDPTRLLRLARYAARLGFEPAPQTRALAAVAITNGALDTISATRAGNELRLLAREPDPISAFEAVEDLGLPWAIDAERARSALNVLPDEGRADIVVLACVFGGQDGAQLAAELDRLGFAASDRDSIVEGVTAAEDLAQRLGNAGSRSEIARTVGRSGIETVALASSQGAPSQSLTWLEDLRHCRLQISGDDLIDHGLQQGPAIGRALQVAKDALLDGRAPDREAQLAVALHAAE